MKSLKINSLLAIGFVTGLFVAGSMNSLAQGYTPPSVRDCARQMCFMLRNCGGGGEQVVKTKKAEGQKVKTVEKRDQNDTQGFSESCRQWAFQEYLYCSEGGNDGVKPQDKVKPADTKK